MTKRLAVNEPPGLPWPLRPQGDLPDTNVWLALAAEEHPQHAAARAYWAGAHAGDGGDTPFLWFCRLTMLGMVRLLWRVDDEPWAPDLRFALPTGGQGTLEGVDLQGADSPLVQ